MSIMNAAVSGMNADTSWLSTISQNVANANTTGYKNAETQFSALVDGASTGSYDAAGVTTSSQSLNTVQGQIVAGSSVTDLAIQGAGYFVVSNSSGETFLTQAGAFVPDASGNLINAQGYYLMGYNAQNGPPVTVANSLTGMQIVNVNPTGAQQPGATATTSGVFAANLPSTATAVAAADLPSANPTTGAAPTEETALVAYNNLGGTQTVNLYLTKTTSTAAPPVPDTWEVTAYDASTAAPGGGFPYAAGGLLGTQTINFDPTTGQLASTSPTSLAFQVPNGQNMTLDLSGMTQLASGYTVNSASTNGSAASGGITGVSIGTEGTLSFQYANGSTMPGYDIPIANVASPDHLTSVSGNAFQANLNSGPIQVGTAGQAGLGTIASSSLESSTVDLATELTNMIQAQSAYEANSKVFQTGANILDVLNNLKS